MNQPDCLGTRRPSRQNALRHEPKNRSMPARTGAKATGFVISDACLPDPRESDVFGRSGRSIRSAHPYDRSRPAQPRRADHGSIPRRRTRGDRGTSTLLPTPPRVTPERVSIRSPTSRRAVKSTT